MKCIIIDLELGGCCLRRYTDYIYGMTLDSARIFNSKKEAQEFIKAHPQEHFADSEWYGKDSRVVVKYKKGSSLDEIVNEFFRKSN